MKYLIYVHILLCLISCSQTSKNQEESERPLKNKVQAEESKTTIDSIEQVELKDESSQSLQIEILNPEDYNLSKETANIYLDRVYYFKSTNEFYVSLSFNEGYSYDSIGFIRTKLDTVVYEDGEIRRTSLALELGHKYFNTSLLNEITIFDYSHKKVQNSRLKRIEFFQDSLGDQFIAVFDCNELQDQFGFYGISGTDEFTKNFKARQIDKEYLIKKLKDEWGIKPQYNLSSSSVEITTFGTTLISFAYHTFNNTAVTYLIEQKEDSVNTLLRFEDEYYIWQLIPTSIIYKNKPILLLWVGLPDTDIEWYTSAVFDGAKYKLSNGSRISLDSSLKKEVVGSVICSTSVLLETLQNIDSLCNERIDLFLKTFSESCNNNAEFSEFGQELIFEVFSKYPNEVVTLISENDYNLEAIMSELESPLLDPLIESIISDIKSTGVSNSKIDSILLALKRGNEYLIMATEKHYDLDDTFRKRARNSNIAVISILLVHTLDIKFDGINLFGQATLKFGSPESVHEWLWLFFGFYTFRFIQAYFTFRKENEILFWDKTYKNNLAKAFYPRKFEEAWVDNELTKGKFRFTEVSKGSSKNFDTPYFILGPIQTPSYKNTTYSVPVSKFKYWTIRIFIFIPSLILSLITHPDFLTAHLPFLMYLALALFFIFN